MCTRVAIVSALWLITFSTSAMAAELYLRKGEIPVYNGWTDASEQRNEIGRIQGGRPAAELSRLHRQTREFYRIEHGEVEGIVRAEDFLLSETDLEDEGLIQFLPANGSSFFRGSSMAPPRLTNNGRYLINSNRAFLDLELERVVLELGPVTNSAMGQGVLTETRYVSTSTGTSDQSRLIVYDTDNISQFQEYSSYDYGMSEFQRIWHSGQGDVIFATGQLDGDINDRRADLIAVNVLTGEELFRHSLKAQNSYVNLARMNDGRWLVLQRGGVGGGEHLYLLDPVGLSIDRETTVDFATDCSAGGPRFKIFEEDNIVEFGLECSDHSSPSYFAAVDLERFELLWKKVETGLTAIQYTPEVGYFHSPRYGKAFAADIFTGERTDDPRPFPPYEHGESRRSYEVSSPDGTVSVMFRGSLWVRPNRHVAAKEDVTFASGLRQNLSITRSGPGLDKSFDVSFARRQWADLDPESNLLRTVIMDGPEEKAYFEWTLGQPEVSIAQPLPEDVFWLSGPEDTPRKALVLADLEDVDKRLVDIHRLAPGSRVASDGEIILAPPRRNSLTSCQQSNGNDIWKWSGAKGRHLLLNLCFIDTQSDDGTWSYVDDMTVKLRSGCSYRRDDGPCRSTQISELKISHRLVETDGGTALVSYGITSDNGIEVLVQHPDAPEVPRYLAFDFLDRDFHLYDQGDDTYNASLYVLPPMDGALRFLVRGVPKTDPKMRGEYGPTFKSTFIYRFDLLGNQIGAPMRSSSELSPDGLIGAQDIAADNDAVVIAGSSGGLYFFDATMAQVSGHPRHPGFTGLGNAEILMGDGYTVVPQTATASDVFNTATGERLATLYFGPDGAALALLPSGFFSFNELSAAADILVRNRETNRAVPLSAFAETFYRPDLVQAALVGDPGRQLADARAAVSLADAFGAGPAPLVTDLTLEQDNPPGAVIARASLSVGEGGLGWLLWRVNGKVVAIDESQAGAEAEQVQITRKLPLSVGSNEVSVQATNSSRLQSSEPVSVEGPEFAGDAAPGKLHILTVAVQDYADDRLDLAYPTRDAEAFEEALVGAATAQDARVGPASLLGRDVSVTRLFDQDVTRARVAETIRDMSERMHPNDVFVLFVAGHGLTDEGRFHFLASDVRTGRDPKAELAERAISQNDLNRWLSRLPAQRSIVLIDACESGSALRMDAAFRLHQAAVNGPVGDGTTRLMLSASAETQYALEGHNGHGAFTSVLLDAFASGDQNGDGLISATELSDHVRNTLPELTSEKWSYRQVPQINLIGEDIILGSSIER